MADDPKPTPANTAEYVRGMKQDSRARSRGIVLTLLFLVAGGGSAVFYVITHATPVAPSPDPVPTEAPAAAPAVSAEQAQEALKNAPKDVAVLVEAMSAKPPAKPSATATQASTRSAKATAAPEALPDDIHSSFQAPASNAYEMAREMANERRGAVQLCYERELKRNPNLHGHVTVDLQLKAPHTVGEIRVVDNLRRESFTECVTQAMKQVDFPPLREDLTFEIPFALKSAEL
jgi:hypothetical protein